MSTENSFYENIKEIERLNKRSIKAVYYLNNLLRDCYIKLERCKANNVSDTTYDYFNNKLRTYSRIREDRKLEFLLNKANVEATYKGIIEYYKKELFDEYKKVCPNSVIENVDDLLIISREVLVLDKNFENQLMNLFEKINNSEDVKMTLLEQKYMNLAYIVVKLYPTMECHDILEGIFEMVDENGGALYKDTCYGNNTKMPDAFKINDKTYAISITKLNRLRSISNIIVRKFEKDLNNTTRKINILESKTKTCKNIYKEIVYIQRLKQEIRSKHIYASFLSDSKVIKSEVENILERKAGINSLYSPDILKLDIMLQTISNKIFNGVDNLLLRITTPDKISEVVDYIDSKNEHLVVHNNEVEAILESGKNMLVTLIPTMELAYLTDKYIYLPKELVEYSAQVVKFLNDENAEHIEEQLQELAKADKMTVQEKKECLTDEQVENLGYDKQMLKHIVFQTPNGNYTFDGKNLINAVTNEVVELESIDQVDKIFGIEEIADEQGSFEDFITNILEEENEINDDGGME